MSPIVSVVGAVVVQFAADEFRALHGQFYDMLVLDAGSEQVHVP
jgi:hypothetical protein